MSFFPAMSAKAKKAKGKQIRAWHLNRRSGSDLSGIAEDINPQVRGWINYYGAFYRSELCFIAKRINEHIVRWAMQKFKRLRGKPKQAWAWLIAARQRNPGSSPTGAFSLHTQPTCGSRMTRESHVRFCESRGVRFPPATRPEPLERLEPCQTRDRPPRSTHQSCVSGRCGWSSRRSSRPVSARV